MADVVFGILVGKGLGDVSIDEECGCLENIASEQNERCPVEGIISPSL
jgi:hypothetical protein